MFYTLLGDFPGGSDRKESACKAGHRGSVPGSGTFPGEGNGNPLQYFCLGNPMDRGDLWATVHGVTRVRHNLAIKSPPPPNGYIKFTITDNRELEYINIKT